ncbi:hypothetical protein CDAR_594631 [Caerostris darwini]|uniref:Uncharacterized protein n=1 Tax=Caerostris darwini TaxID=1538125 RepID=A0AAV4WSE7_9ARAC|nr:hypothetical protein CDAR_594631 [Caerostris darwini]
MIKTKTANANIIPFPPRTLYFLFGERYSPVDYLTTTIIISGTSCFVRQLLRLTSPLLIRELYLMCSAALSHLFRNVAFIPTEEFILYLIVCFIFAEFLTVERIVRTFHKFISSADVLLISLFRSWHYLLLHPQKAVAILKNL